MNCRHTCPQQSHHSTIAEFRFYATPADFHSMSGDFIQAGHPEFLFGVKTKPLLSDFAGMNTVGTDNFIMTAFHNDQMQTIFVKFIHVHRFGRLLPGKMALFFHKNIVTQAHCGFNFGLIFRKLHQKILFFHQERRLK